jgi:hypothetical protein
MISGRSSPPILGAIGITIKNSNNKKRKSRERIKEKIQKRKSRERLFLIYEIVSIVMERP